MRPVAAGYFSGPVFAPAASGELFRRYTCHSCGTRLKTWAHFRAHREDCRRLPVAAADATEEDHAA